MASAGFEPVNLGTKGQHATPRPPKPLLFVYENKMSFADKTFNTDKSQQNNTKIQNKLRKACFIWKFNIVKWAMKQNFWAQAWSQHFGLTSKFSSTFPQPWWLSLWISVQLPIKYVARVLSKLCHHWATQVSANYRKHVKSGCSVEGSNSVWCGISIHHWNISVPHGSLKISERHVFNSCAAGAVKLTT